MYIQPRHQTEEKFCYQSLPVNFIMPDFHMSKSRRIRWTEFVTWYFIGCPRSVATAVATDLEHPYCIYITPTQGMHLWLLLQFLVLLMMDAESVRNRQSNLAVTNKRYCQSCILLVPYVIQTYDARKLKHKKIVSWCVEVRNAHDILHRKHHSQQQKVPTLKEVGSQEADMFPVTEGEV